MKLSTLVASTRPGHKGTPIAQWIHALATEHGGFETEMIELSDIDLPLLDEPNHPRLKQYVHEHTKRWSEIVDATDAFIFVTPEYNYGTPPALNNALNYLYQEWNYKPVAFVSYGGISGGTRSVQMTKQIVTTLKMVPLVEAVNLPFFSQYFDESGHFQGTDSHITSAHGMLEELHRWTEALKPMRHR